MKIKPVASYNKLQVTSIVAELIQLLKSYIILCLYFVKHSHKKRIQIRITYLDETVFYITFTFLYNVPFLRKSITRDLLCGICFILECYKPKLITPHIFYCISKNQIQSKSN